MKRLTILILVLAVALVSGNVIDAKTKGGKNNNRTNPPANLNELMKAPSVQTDEYGFYNINLDAPRIYPKVRVEIMEGGAEAKIFVDLKLFQTISFDVTHADNDEIKFFDANFDGYVDIFIGLGSSREYSAIFLWNPTQKKFIQDKGKSDLNGLMLVNPSKKELYSAVTSSAFRSIFSIHKWYGNRLKETETLHVITDEVLGQGTECIVYDNNGKTILETNSINKLPIKWKNIISCFHDYYKKLEEYYDELYKTE